MRVDVTVTSELGRRSTPARGIGATAGNIGGNARVREDPDTDGITGPLSGINTATVVVEAVSIGAGAGASDGTTGIFRLFGSLDVAVAGLDAATKARVIDRAAIAGVQGHLVG